MKFSLDSTPLMRTLALAGLFIAGCTATKKADEAFYRKGEHGLAAQLYQEALAKGGKASYLNGQIAESYRLSNRLKEAAPFYKAALDAGATGDSLKYYYAKALRANGQYDSAAAAFADYAKTGANPALVKAAKTDAANAKASKAILETKSNFEVRLVDGDVNTASSDFSPFIMKDMVFFSSDRRKERLYNGDGSGFLDIYMGRVDKNKQITKDSVKIYDDFRINVAGQHEANLAFSRDGKELVFARSNDGSRRGPKSVDLFHSKYVNGAWTDPEPLPLNDPLVDDVAPSFSPDGKSLYFASARAGGQGGLDIYRATKDASGKWARVTNMGKEINTAGEESFPFVSEDGKLYFSSDGHPGLGSLDLFVAERGSDKKITIKNLGTPVNSTSDDFGILWINEAEGYFSSNREGGKGGDDIYYFVDRLNEPKIVNFVTKINTLGKKDDGSTEILPNAHVVVLGEDGKKIAESSTGDNGVMEVPMEPNKNYTFVSDVSGYYTKRENFTTLGKTPPREELKEKETTVTLTADLVFDKIKVNQTFVVENIYYEFNKATITAEAGEELDKLVEFLQDNPQIAIELSSHTDARGSADYNNKLSQARAESAVNYMVSKGIAKERMTAKGYGFSVPIIENAVTEEDFQKNRRTEFKITKILEQK